MPSSATRWTPWGAWRCRSPTGGAGPPVLIRYRPFANLRPALYALPSGGRFARVNLLAEGVLSRVPLAAPSHPRGRRPAEGDHDVRAQSYPYGAGARAPEFGIVSIRLSDDEAWSVLDSSHTGILTTLRRDGVPITLPVWFVVLDGTVCFRSPSRTKKVARLRNDPRAAFLVESGLRWAELRAVHLNGVVEVVDDEASIARIDEALREKHAAFQTASAHMPESAQQLYRSRTFFRLRPEGKLLTWDNRRLPLAGRS
jgi:nitroimidazol reductase NimA-like FMN-containing flavoprotein (pyridoxamine 5'-phosphate oxidase superfamily)